MALAAAISFAILFTGAALVWRDRGWIAHVLADDSGGVAARRLLPAGIALPFVLGWVASQTSAPRPLDTPFVSQTGALGTFDTPFGFAIVAVVTTLGLGGFVCGVAAMLSRADRRFKRTADILTRVVEERSRAEGQLRRSENQLRLFIKAAPAA